MFVRPYHLAQLSALCDEYPVAGKLVFLPSRQIGYNVGQALAASGRSWVNLHLTTPVDWAERLVGPSIRAEGWRPLVQDADLFFVQSLVKKLDWPESPSENASIGVARSFLGTLRALRGAGLDPARVERSGLRNGSILGPMYRAYCEWMSEHRLYDHTHLFAKAREVASTGGSALVAVFDELTLTRSAFEFVEALADRRPLRIGRESYAAALPQHCAGARFGGASIVERDRGCVHPAVDLLKGEAAKSSSPVQLREAIGLENEVRGILRELLRSGEPLDTVEIAYTIEDPYLSLLVEMTNRFDLPVTVAAGVPVTSTSPGQALVKFFGWIAGGFAPSDFIRMCRSRLLDTESTFSVASEQIGQILEESRVGRGRNAYSEALARFENRLSTRLDDSSAGVPQRLDWVRRVQGVVKRLSEICPSEETSSLSELSAAGIAFLEEFAPTSRTEQDGTAAESLYDRLVELGAGPEFSGPVREIARTLVELLSEHKIEASVAQPGCLHIVPLQRAGYAGRDHVVIIGMAETSFPGVAIEDPILLDDERRSLSSDLRIERTRSSDAVWQLERALGMASSTITLVSNRRTLADARETYPSAVFQEIADSLKAEPKRTYYPTPATDEALDEPELVLSVRQFADVRGPLEAERPWLARGLLAQRSRNECAIGRYDGWLGEMTAELRPGVQDVLSSSRLEDLAACPYRYFIKHVLHVRPPDMPEEMPGRWLTPMEFGSLLHRVLREFMESLASRGQRIDAQRHEGLLESVLQRHVEAIQKQVPVTHDAGFRVDVNRLRRAARIFLNEESRREVEPIGFEVSFGLGESDGLSRPDPVEVELSDSIRFPLRGSIDRVDRSSQGYEVWDYKTGSTYDFDEFDLLMGGRRLQWALYAFAMEQILVDAGVTGRVARSGYFFTSDREHGLRLSQPPPSKEKVAERLEALFDLVSEGGFPHVQKGKECTFCDYNAVCASERRDGRDMDDIRESTPSERSFLEPLERWMQD